MKRLLITTAYAAAITAFALTAANAQIKLGGDTTNNTAIAGASAAASSTAIAAQGQMQGQSQGQSQSASSNNNNQVSQSATVNNNTRNAASSAIAGSISSGGNCNVGIGIGLSEFTGSISTGISWQNVPCVVLQEAVAFHNMGMKTEAITHLASYHKRMGPTLRQTGKVVAPATPVTSSRSVTSRVTTAGFQGNDFSR